MTLKQKYKEITHTRRMEIMTGLAKKMRGSMHGVYLTKQLNEGTIPEHELPFINKVFDRQLKWQEEDEKKHYENLYN